MDVLCRLPTPKKARKETLDFVSEYLDHPRPGLQIAAIRGIGQLGHPGSRRLLKALADSPNDRVKDAADKALRSLDDKSPGRCRRAEGHD